MLTSKKLFFWIILFVFINHPVFAVKLIPLKSFHNAKIPKSVEVAPNGQYAAVMNIEGMNVWLIDTTSLIKKQVINFYPRRATGWNYRYRTPIRSYAQKPVECDFSENGRFLWTSLHNDGSVVVYDTQQQIKVTQESPFEKVLIRSYNKRSSDIIYLKKIKTGKTPKIIKVSPDGKYTLVSNWHSNTVSVIDAANFKLIKNIQVGHVPRGIAISPDSTRAYVANMGGGTLSVIDLKELKVIAEDPLTPNPRHLALSKDGKYLYISDNAWGLVIKYDVEQCRIIKKRYIGQQARTLTISNDGQYIFAVAHKSHRLVVLSTTNLRVLLSKYYYHPMGVSISPDDSQLWVSSFGGMKVTVYQFIKDWQPL